MMHVQTRVLEINQLAGWRPSVPAGFPWLTGNGIAIGKI